MIFLRAALSAFLLLLLAAAPGVAQDRALTVVSPWEISDLEPLETGYVFRRMGVGETLVEVEPDGRLSPGLAESWSTDPDRLTWRFKIRSGARFHDGAPVTPDAVANSLRKVRAGAESLQALPIESMRVEGDQLVIQTARPFAPLASYLTDYAGIILSPNAYGPDGKVKALIGTGPYQVQRIDGQKQMDLTAFPDYWGQKASITKLRYIAAVQGETRAALAESGEAGLTFTLLPQAAQRIERSGRAKIASVTLPRARVINFNCDLPFFSDARVRRAVGLAIDRAGIASAVLRHPGSHPDQLLPAVLTEWRRPGLSPLRQDVAAAKALLAEAGWRPGPSGLLEKQGVVFQVSMLLPSNRPEFPVIGSVLQAQLKEVGIGVELKIAPSSQMPQAIRDGSLQMGFLSRTYVNVPDPIGTIIPDFTQERSVWGAMNWRNEPIRRLAAAYVESFDPPAQAAMRAEIMAILDEEAPVVPVAWTEHLVAVSPALADVVIDPFEQRYLLNRLRWAN